MKISAKGEKLLKSIRSEVQKQGVVAKKLSADLMDLRNFYIESKDPLATRVLRLTATYLEENGTYDLDLLADYEEDEEGNTGDMAMVDSDDEDSFSRIQENFLFFLDLLAQNDNEKNRAELQRIKHAFIAMGHA